MEYLENFPMIDELKEPSNSKALSASAYHKEIMCLKERNFDSILNLAKKRLKDRGQFEPCVSEQLYNSLIRGTAILETEEQVDKYIQAFGRKHYIKFKNLFETIPTKIFDDFFDIVDWGCGPGLGIIALDDFCRRKLNHKIESQARQIILIEPSEVSLTRAKIHANLLLPESLVKGVNKRFEELTDNDFPLSLSALGIPRIHLFSNIMDLELFKRERERQQIFNLIKNRFKFNEYFLCVSPSYNDVKQTFQTFIDCLNDDDLEREIILEPIEKIFTKEADGCEVKMTAVAIRIQSKKAIESLKTIKNKQLISELNARRDSTDAQRKLVRFIAMRHSETECDILYKPNLMGDMPDMLILKKGYKAKLIYVCEVSDITTESLNKIINIAYVADSLKQRLYNLLSRSLIIAYNNSKSIFGIITCVIFLPNLFKIAVNLKELLINADLELNYNKLQDECSNVKNKKELSKKIEKDWKYRELYTSDYRDLNWTTTNMMSNDIYLDLKNLLIPQPINLKQEKIVFGSDSKQAGIINSVAGENKKIFGVFGSGKTTAMVARAISAYKRVHRTILILTYNITLRRYIEGMILMQFGEFNRNQFYVVNYHEFIKGECHYIGVTKDIHYNDYNFFNEHKNRFRKYDAIFIDEAQDYNIHWFRIIKDIFLSENGEYVICGDEKQNIYGNILDDNKQIKTNIRGKPFLLKLCYRSNYEIMNRVKEFQQKMFALKYEIDDIECVNKQNSFESFWEKVALFDVSDGDIDMLIKIISTIHKEYEVPYSEMAVLGSSIQLLRLCEKSYRDASGCQTECMFIHQEEFDDMNKRYYNNKLKLELDRRERGLKLHFDTNKDAIKFSTIHSYKGCESNTIIVIIQSKANNSHNDNELELIYTGLTRARKNLFIVNYGETQYSNELKSIFMTFE